MYIHIYYIILNYICIYAKIKEPILHMYICEEEVAEYDIHELIPATYVLTMFQHSRSLSSHPNIPVFAS